VLGIAFGGVVYFFLKEPAGEYYAVLAAILAAWALPLSHGDLVSARRFLIDIMLKDPLVAKRRLRRPPDGVAREKRPEGGGWANKNCDTARS
jgi:hypothetical protein